MMDFFQILAKALHKSHLFSNVHFLAPVGYLQHLQSSKCESCTSPLDHVCSQITWNIFMVLVDDVKHDLKPVNNTHIF